MRVLKLLSLGIFLTLFIVPFISNGSVSAADGDQPVVSLGPCDSTTFFGLPAWYKYLETEKIKDESAGGESCDIKIGGLSDTWLVVAAIIDILLRLAALIAVGFIIYGGVLYILSQSQPDKTKQAQATVINAVIGLIIAIIATAAVTFFAGKFK